MKTYNVEITETLQMTVKIEAESALEAEETVQKEYKNEDYILGAEHFVGVSFRTRAAGRENGSPTKRRGQDR